nr:polysaccharide pyruvyl transferase family protein [uncultured Mediterraneibacter sp.]
MKITVITPFDSSNFGAFLQAYCLKMQLENMGYTVNHLLTREPDYITNLYYKSRPTSKKEFVFWWKFEKKKKYGMRKLELFRKDQEIFSVVDRSEKADVYVLGSDEIWNINQPVFQREIFWGSGLNPVISYAASIGGADIKKLMQDTKYTQAIEKMKAVLVRDVQTKKFVESIGKETEIVCDPTMLIAIDKYGEELQDEYISKNECLLVYAYYVSKSEKKILKNYAKAHGLKIVSCCFWHDWCDYQCECGPLKFSSLIRQCRAVFTTTFHGSIFSILNHANFVSVPTSPKTSQLLEQFGLKNRLLPEKEFSESNLTGILNGEPINYNYVEKKIELIRETSKKKLADAIGSAHGG